MDKGIKKLKYSICILAAVGFFAEYQDSYAATAGELDAAFNIGSGANSHVNYVTTQPNGKILISGAFTSFSGISRNRTARLNSDGSLDTSFVLDSEIDNGYILDSETQPDGKIVIGGYFGGGFLYGDCIARINTDGSYDTSFNVGTGANEHIFDVAMQSDGKVIISGEFTRYNGTNVNGLARLNTDGSLDTSFNIGTGTGVSNSIWAVGILPDDKIIIGGSFTSFNGTARNRIARLNSDGSLDTSFNIGTGANNGVYSSVIQSDGKILISGAFTSYDGVARDGFARLNTDGSLDTSFDPGSGTSGIHDMVVQSDGKIIFEGSFTSYNGTARNGIARINGDGTLDASFNPGSGPNSDIDSIAIQSDDKIIIGGWFTSYNSISAPYIARVVSETVVTVPVINTDFPEYISETSVSGVGNIIDTGDEDPAREIEWGITSGNYTDSCSAGVGGAGQYSCTMTNLISGTTYYVRAKATNSAGATYGSEIVYYFSNDTIYYLTAYDAELHSLNLGDYSSLFIDNVTGDIGTVYTINGVSVDPITNDIYVIATFDNDNTLRYLATFDMDAKYITVIGNMGDNFGAIAFDHNGNLYGLTGDGATVPSSFYAINKTNAQTTLLASYTTNGGGESLAFNADDELMYRATGNDIFSIDTNNPTVLADVVVDNAEFSSTTALYYAGNSHLYLVDYDQLYRVNLDTSDVDNVGVVSSSGTKSMFSWTPSTETPTTQSGTNQLSATIAQNMTLSCGGDIDLNGGTPLIPQTPATSQTICTVTTNDQNGYDLQLTSDRGTNNTLYHNTQSITSDGQITDKSRWNPSSPNASNFTGTGLAFGVLSSDATKNTTWWGDATTCNSTDQLYAGIPATSTAIMEHIDYSNTPTDTTICYQVNVPSTQISGLYEGSVTYTATGRP